LNSYALQQQERLARLYRVGNSGELIEASEKPFSDETNDLENFVKKNPKILGDLVIFGELGSF
jgi:hypothetical protein